MNDVTHDLRALAEMELPPKENPFGRNVVKLTILCFAVMLIACVGGLIYALRSSIERESELEESLRCVRESSYEYDDAVGNAVKLLVDLDVPVTDALVAVARDDQAALEAALKEADAAVRSADAIKEQIDRAVEARKAALDTC